MTVYEYHSWAGDRRTVEADRVTFEPGHVAFWKMDPSTLADQLILAEDNAEVHKLRPVVST